MSNRSRDKSSRPPGGGRPILYRIVDPSNAAGGNTVIRAERIRLTHNVKAGNEIKYEVISEVDSVNWIGPFQPNKHEIYPGWPYGERVELIGNGGFRKSMTVDVLGSCGNKILATVEHWRDGEKLYDSTTKLPIPNVASYGSAVIGVDPEVIDTDKIKVKSERYDEYFGPVVPSVQLAASRPYIDSPAGPLPPDLNVALIFTDISTNVVTNANVTLSWSDANEGWAGCVGIPGIVTDARYCAQGDVGFHIYIPDCRQVNPGQPLYVWAVYQACKVFGYLLPNDPTSFRFTYLPPRGGGCDGGPWPGRAASERITNDMFSDFEGDTYLTTYISNQLNPDPALSRIPLSVVIPKTQISSYGSEVNTNIGDIYFEGTITEQ